MYKLYTIYKCICGDPDCSIIVQPYNDEEQPGAKYIMYPAYIHIQEPQWYYDMQVKYSAENSLYYNLSRLLEEHKDIASSLQYYTDKQTEPYRRAMQDGHIPDDKLQKLLSIEYRHVFMRDCIMWATEHIALPIHRFIKLIAGKYRIYYTTELYEEDAKSLCKQDNTLIYGAISDNEPDMCCLGPDISIKEARYRLTLSDIVSLICNGSAHGRLCKEFWDGEATLRFERIR